MGNLHIYKHLQSTQSKALVMIFRDHISLVVLICNNLNSHKYPRNINEISENFVLYIFHISIKASIANAQMLSQVII